MPLHPRRRNANACGARDVCSPRPACARRRPRRDRTSRAGRVHRLRRRRHDPGRRRRSGLPIIRSGGRGSRHRTRRWRRRARRRCGRLGRRGGSRPRRQQRERVDIPLRVVGAADAEVHVGHVELEVAGRPHRADRLTFCDAVALRQGDAPEVRQRHRKAVLCPDRRRPTVPRQPPGERHPPGGRRRDRRAGRGADVDAGVAALVVLGPAELEAAEHRSVGRPAPAPGGRGSDQCSDQYAQCCCHSRQHLRRN
jgi:hypothetical protein